VPMPRWRDSVIVALWSKIAGVEWLKKTTDICTALSGGVSITVLYMYFNYLLVAVRGAYRSSDYH